MTIVSAVDAFVAAQNGTRSGVTPLDYDSLTGSVPAGGNSVTGISGIASGATTIALPPSGIGNAVIVDGGISTAASTSGADSYSLAVGADGTLTLTDNNTGFSQGITGAHEIVFDLASTTSSGAYQSSYIVATGNAAIIASMYGAALERAPDFAGLDFYLSRLGSSVEPDLHMAATYILGSPEEAKLYPSTLTTPDGAGPNNTQFVTEMYGGILHRTPTASEVSFYLGALAGTLTDSSGHTLAAVDRATVLEYFSASPENQANIAGIKGGWLINSANGAVNFGVLTSASARAVLASDVASGTVNLSDFANMASDGSAGTGTVTVDGPNYTLPGTNLKTPAQISIGQANLTVNLTAQYNLAGMAASGLTVNGVSTGGSIITTPGSLPLPGVLNDGGTVNLFANNNQVWIGNPLNGGITTPTVINGWNSTDFLTEDELSVVTGTILQGSPSSPISGAALAAQNHNQGFQPGLFVYALNVGLLTNDSMATLVAAAQKDYQVADVSGESLFVFGTDPQGNTLAGWWRGDKSGAHIISQADMTGFVELMGISSLTGANFHS